MCLRSGPDPKGRRVAVWSVLPLKGTTIVTGDGQGRVVFWDSRFGTQLVLFRVHEADVTTLAATKDCSHVFASGVDVQIAMFRLFEHHPGRGLVSVCC